MSLYFENNNYENQAVQLVKNVIDDVKKNSGYYSNWALAANFQIFGAIENAIVGKSWKEKLSQFHKKYLPNVIYLGGANKSTLSLLENKSVEGKTMIYICKNKSCDLPVDTAAEAIQQIKKASGKE